MGSFFACDYFLMKRKSYILLIILLFILGFGLSYQPLIILIAKKELRGLFINSEVSLGGCRLNSASELALFNLELKRDKIYDFKVKEAKISFGLASLFRRQIPKLYLGNASLSLHLTQQNIKDFSQYLHLQPGVFALKSMELANLSLNLKAKDIALRATVSAEISPVAQSLNYLDLKIDSWDTQGLRLNNASLEVSKQKPGQLNIGQIQYDQVKIAEIKGRTRLKDQDFFIDSLSAKIFSGEIQGNLSLKIDQEIQYLCRLKFVNIDLADFTNAFNLQEKLRLSGRLVGELAFEGRAAEISFLSGDFSAVSPGGTLTIKDEQFLKGMGQKSGQSWDIVVESFQDYRYNTAVMKLYLEQRNLIFDIALEGEKGKRNLNVTLHNFKLGKGGA